MLPLIIFSHTLAPLSEKPFTIIRFRVLLSGLRDSRWYKWPLWEAIYICKCRSWWKFISLSCWAPSRMNNTKHFLSETVKGLGSVSEEPVVITLLKDTDFYATDWVVLLTPMEGNNRSEAVVIAQHSDYLEVLESMGAILSKSGVIPDLSRELTIICMMTVE